MEEIRTTIYHNLLLADINRRYFGYLSSRYYNIDFYSKVFLAVMASGTVAGWAFFKDAATYPYSVVAWKAFSSISAVVSIIMPIANVGKKLEAASRVQGEWSEIMFEYETLFSALDNMTPAKAVSENSRLGVKEAKLSHLEATLPQMKVGLKRRCQNEMNQARGIS